MAVEQPKIKKFQGGERSLTAPSQRASRFYSTEDNAVKRKVGRTHDMDGELQERLRNDVVIIVSKQDTVEVEVFNS